MAKPEMTAKSDPQLQSRRRTWIPYGVLVGALLLTGIATFSAAQLFETRDELQFANGVHQTLEAIERRLEIYTEMLVLGSLLYSASVEVTPDEFRNYVRALRVNERYPGIRGIGFSMRLRPDQKDEVIARMRQNGHADFRIWPETQGDECYTITYLEPLDWRNQRALGYNMFTDPVRQAAMVRARDSGSPAASGKVILVQETEEQVQPGFLIYVPVYAGGKTPLSMEERRRDLIGFVFSPFRAGDLLQGIFRPEHRLPVEFRVFDGTAARMENFLYQSPRSGTAERQPWFRSPQTVDIAGRTWTLEFASSANLESTSGIVAVPFLALAGLAVSFVLFRLTSSQSSAYTAAERNARELRRSQQALRESEDRLRHAIESGELGTWEFDPLTRESRWSPRAATLLGVPSDTSISYGLFLSRVVPEDRKGLQERMARALDPQGDGQYEFDFRSMGQDGLAHWLSARGRALFENTPAGRKACRFTGTVLDVTRRKQVEESTRFLAEAGRILSESLDYHRTLASLARLAVPRMADLCAVDMLNSEGRIERLEVVHLDPIRVEQAQALRRQFPLDPQLGYGIAAVIRTGKPEIYPEIPDSLLVQAAQNPDHLRLLRAIGIRSAMVVPIKARDRIYGALSFVMAESGRNFSAEDLPLAEGLASRAGVAVDNALLYRAAQQEILERKRAEEEIQRLNHELEVRVRRRTAALQETNEQLEAFTYTVAHDLRAPLRAMQGFSQALLEDYSAQLGASGRDYAGRVIAAAQRMDALIQDLLAYSRLSRSHLTSEAVELEPIVERVLVNFHAELRSKQALVDVARPLPRVQAHPTTLEHVVNNLLSNALKFVAPGIQPRVRIWAEVRGSAVRVFVEDNGIGISTDHHERIFRVFERLHGTDSFPGTGIGLAIVKKGIERMQGTVGLDSAPNRGSVFWFELPGAP